jgi:hypothetical protein
MVDWIEMDENHLITHTLHNKVNAIKFQVLIDCGTTS